MHIAGAFQFIVGNYRKRKAEREEIVRQFRQVQADCAPYARYADALNGAIVGAPADPEAFGG